ncbi:AMP-dependent synthetase and ligase [Chthoniobacter flavus Ellin428]|uniref:AMP-dependent synthetase and ligase n=1 Tax=Chthoniobacter flavus Ellin428 TaxID=497964 RepID=B4D9R6_9BACT|nr:AMP-binding protein [Chthoniobacter flavus]EDY16847.1 AMP-dependent synthetase and ligase [Chthoniobacter flavus Ellin428]TCO93330.1 acyl-[acyl-carrier-protein]-phospholipid O-acyltransferase/long-chain-fatty-acid--[acyl-carrier-protein] ligase [Chthoniobacter flavus]
MDSAARHTSLAERIIRGLGQFLASIIYRVKAHGVEQLPKGGFLLLPNHLTWVDAVILQLACPRPIRFVVFADIYNLRWLNPIFRAVGALPISPRKAKDAVKLAVEAIQAGEIVCIFPEGELSRSGMLLRLKRGYELIARQAEAEVVPVWLDQLWGSVFSFKGGKYFFKWPRQFPYPVTVAFGTPLKAEEADIATVRSRFLELGEFCYQHRPMLRGHLGEACLRGLKKHQFDVAVIDGFDQSKLTRGSLLAVAITLSRYIRRECSRHRVAIVLPPGKAGLVVNLAVLLADKVPVNLNFTAGRAAIEASMAIAEIKHCITAHAVTKRLADFPWPEHTLMLDEILPPMKRDIALWRAAVCVTPAWVLARALCIPREGDHAEAFLLFTSGSSGAPKGVALTHRNLLGNVAQFALMLEFERGESVLGSLPFFHSFGATVTILFPMMEPVTVVTYPNPLEIAKLAGLIERYKISLVVTTPTFLRGYMRKAEPKQLASLKLLVTGAEKLPADLQKSFEEQFGMKVLQGYGLTETSPVVAFNLPEVKAPNANDPVQPSSRDGSIGKLAPGIAARICDPNTDEPLSLHATGMLWLKGANIFDGYLDDPKRTAEVLKDGWFKTGDLARFDEDGFCFIEGRLSRFSKIGGEMVPHETVESRIVEAFDLAKESERTCAITAIPDEAKGEALVLLTTHEIDTGDLRKKLSDAGLPNLWIPKIVKRVDAVPVLGTGKLDIQRCKELAAQA